MDLNYVRLLTNEFEKMVHFYEEILGLERKFVDEEIKYAEFNAGETTLAIFDKLAMFSALGMKVNEQSPDKFDNTVIIFRVENLEKVREKIKEKGVSFLCDLTDRPEWGVKTLHLRDPTGNLLEINEAIPMK